MKHTLIFGYYGRDSTGGVTIKNISEPLKSIDQIVKFWRLNNKYLKVKIDFGLIHQGDTKNKKREITKIWKKIVSKKHTWVELKPKIKNLLELGDGLLPLAFDINYDNLEVGVVDGEFTIILVTDDINKLQKFMNVLKKELDIRVAPYGRRNQPKILIK